VSAVAPVVAIGRRRPLRTELTNQSVDVDGRRVSYATGGRGLPVLFLHGWGLDHEVYRRSLRRLTARGCRVVAPSLPGFGFTDELPTRRRTLAGYAAWVDRFLDAIGADEPVLVLGHSFGGGIATRFTYDHPERVRYLVLLNAVGDPRAFAAGGVAKRPGLPGLSGLRSMISSLRPAEDLTTTGLMQWTLLANLQRHPFSVMQAAQAALSADLRKEMAELAARELPVLVLSSDDDRVIPSNAVVRSPSPKRSSTPRTSSPAASPRVCSCGAKPRSKNAAMPGKWSRTNFIGSMPNAAATSPRSKP
jgi:pimeloyl-ACP methyl ester carboxylesterase